MKQNLALIELITVPGGTILLGEGADAHEVHVATFHIGRFPVTAEPIRPSPVSEHIRYPHLGLLVN